jgi:hypothetical protein
MCSQSAKLALTQTLDEPERMSAQEFSAVEPAAKADRSQVEAVLLASRVLARKFHLIGVDHGVGVTGPDVDLFRLVV